MGGTAVLVMQDGQVIFEDYHNGADQNTATHIQSGTKGFWAPETTGCLLFLHSIVFLLTVRRGRAWLKRNLCPVDYYEVIICPSAAARLHRVAVKLSSK
jgi:hypothetical protein